MHGWVYIYGATRLHYVADHTGRTLCKRWLYLGTAPPVKIHAASRCCKLCSLESEKIAHVQT